MYINLKNDEYKKELKKFENESKKQLSKNFYISSVELALFKQKGSKIISTNTWMRIFWNNSDTSYWNIFSKRIQFTAIGT